MTTSLLPLLIHVSGACPYNSCTLKFDLQGAKSIQVGINKETKIGNKLEKRDHLKTRGPNAEKSQSLVTKIPN